jgi:hypothetical protein
MIAIIEPTVTNASAPIYHLKVVLNETKPIIWRRLQVPGNANLGWLHAVLQVAMGWTNSHLHQIMVEKILTHDPAAATVALCLGGARACPPEDCGGPWGYDNLLKILRNPKHEEHDSMKEWLGRPLDPAAFDVEKVNTYLRKLKWPRTTESQLRKVFMARDDYDE